MPTNVVTPNISYIQLPDGTHAIDAMYLGGLSVDDIIGSGFTKSIFQTLPAASSQYNNTIGMVPSGSSGEDNIYDEYICVENSGTWSWEKIGSTETALNPTSDTFIKSYPGTFTNIRGVSGATSAVGARSSFTAVTGITTTEKDVAKVGDAVNVITGISAIKSYPGQTSKLATTTVYSAGADISVVKSVSASSTTSVIKSYPGEEARLTTASITPVGSTATAITDVSVSTSANIRDAATTVMTGLGAASKATVPTGITTTTTTVYGTGTTSVAGPGTDIDGILNGATVTNGVLSFTTTTVKSAGAAVTVANGTSKTVLSGASASGTTQVITSYAGETASIYPAANITAVTGITSTSGDFAKAGTAMTVATGATSPASSATNVGSPVLIGLGTAVTANAITGITSTAATVSGTRTSVIVATGEVNASGTGATVMTGLGTAVPATATTTSIIPAVANGTAVGTLSATTATKYSAGPLVTVATAGETTSVMTGLGTPRAATAIVSLEKKTLLNKTYKFNSPINLTEALSSSQFDIQGSIFESSTTFSQLNVTPLGAGSGNKFTFTDSQGSSSVISSTDPYWVYEVGQTTTSLNLGISVTITGGQDVENLELINVFETYGEVIDEPIVEIIRWEKYDEEGRITFYYKAVYDGTDPVTYGDLIYRNSILTEDMVAGDSRFTDSTFSTNQRSFNSRDLGYGIYVRPYIKVGDTYTYGNQIHVRSDKFKIVPDFRTDKTLPINSLLSEIGTQLKEAGFYHIEEREGGPMTSYWAIADIDNIYIECRNTESGTLDEIFNLGGQSGDADIEQDTIWPNARIQSSSYGQIVSVSPDRGTAVDSTGSLRLTVEFDGYI